MSLCGWSLSYVGHAFGPLFRAVGHCVPPLVVGFVTSIVNILRRSMVYSKLKCHSNWNSCLSHVCSNTKHPSIFRNITLYYIYSWKGSIRFFVIADILSVPSLQYYNLFKAWFYKQICSHPYAQYFYMKYYRMKAMPCLFLWVNPWGL